MSHSQVLVSLMAASSLLACTYFVSLDGLAGSGIARDAGAADAADAADATPVEARDSGDGGLDGEAGSGPFCDGQQGALALCDDFDTKPLGFLWSREVKTAGARVELSTENTRSAPNALLTQSTVNGAGTAFLEKDLGTTAQHIVLRFDFFVAARAASYANGAGIRIRTDASNGYQCYLRIAPSGTLAIDEVSTTNGAQQAIKLVPFTKSPLPATWARIALDFQLGTTPPRLVAYLDNDPAPVLDVTLAPPSTVGARFAAIGLSYTAEKDWKAFTDNVTLDVK